ncbi:MAG TPA: zinc ribbon domain-containing protein [bacterium]|nr:zinc ribbon domain-containing protein [bacterium]
MPIYVYQCQSCHHTFEELVFSDNQAASLSCPQCQATVLIRKQAAFATTSGGHDAAPACGSGGCCGCSFDN